MSSLFVALSMALTLCWMAFIPLFARLVCVVARLRFGCTVRPTSVFGFSLVCGDGAHDLQISLGGRRRVCTASLNRSCEHIHIDSIFRACLLEGCGGGLSSPAAAARVRCHWAAFHPGSRNAFWTLRSGSWLQRNGGGPFFHGMA